MIYRLLTLALLVLLAVAIPPRGAQRPDNCGRASARAIRGKPQARSLGADDAASALHIPCRAGGDAKSRVAPVRTKRRNPGVARRAMEMADDHAFLRRWPQAVVDGSGILTPGKRLGGGKETGSEFGFRLLPHPLTARQESMAGLRNAWKKVVGRFTGAPGRSAGPGAGKFLVLEQTAAEDISFQLVREQRLRYEEKLDVSPWGRAPLFMSVSMHPSLSGRVTSFLFQPRPLAIIISRGTLRERYRFVPSMAERPFLLSPVLNTNSDVLGLYSGTPWNSVESVAFERPRHGSAQFQDTFTVRIYSAPGFLCWTSRTTPR